MAKPLHVAAAPPASTPSPMRIAFFAGSDVTAHCIVNRITPALLAQGHSVHLLLTRGKPKKNAPEPLRQMFFLEHTLLQDHAYPYVDRHGVPDASQANTPNGWRSLERPSAGVDIHVQEVPDVNDPEFVEAVGEMGLDLAVSVRCYQKFTTPIIDGLTERGAALLNLHPGLLPHYRGVMTSLRSMQDGAPEAGFTLHQIEPEFDTGAVIGRAVVPVDYSRSVLENMALNYRSAADLILGVLYELSALPTDERTPQGVPQDSDQARYYSYATAADLVDLWHRGIDLFRIDAVVDLIVDMFGGRVGAPQGLRTRLYDALHQQSIPCIADPRSIRAS